MPVLEIAGHEVEVGPEFLNLTPEQQGAEVDGIAASMGWTQQQGPAQGSGTGFGDFAQRETMEPETPELRRDIDAAKAQSGYNALPEWQKPLRAAADVASVAGAGLTAGFSDWLASLASGKTVDEERAITQQARDRMGWLGTATEIGGAVAGPGKIIGATKLVRPLAQAPAATAAGRIGQAVNRAGHTATTGGVMAAEGAALGGAGAIGYGTDLNTNIGIGGALGPAAPVVGKVVGKVAKVFGPKADISSIDDIRAAKNAAYDRSEAAGIVIKPEWTGKLAKEIEDTLAEKGWTPERVPAVAGVLKALERVREGNITLKGVDSIRQVAGNLGGTLDDLQTYLGRQIVKKIDRNIDRLNLDDVVPGIGNLTEATTSLLQARRLNTTMRKAEVVQEAVDKAERLAAGQNTSLHKALQTQFRGILNSKTRRRGFSTDELAAMEKVARGNMSQAVLGWISALAPTNKLNLMLQGATAASTAGSSIPLQIGGAGAGLAAQVAGTRMARNNVYGLARLIRERGLTPDLAAQVRKMPKARRQKLGRVLQGWNVTGAEVEP